MTSAGMNAVKSHVLDQIAKTPLVTSPFPYMYMTEVFPEEYYSTLLEKLPGDEAYKKYHPPYEARLSIELKPDSALTENEFWKEAVSFLSSDDFLFAMASKFGEHIPKVYSGRREFVEPHRSGKNVSIGNRLILTRDYANYAISPHTDAPPKFITGLLYLARDNSMTNFGTSIYAPKDGKFKQWGANRFQDAHLPYEDFTLLETMSYRPNSAIFFLKTDNSFHGVERSEEYANSGRDMLMWVPEVGVNERSWGNNQLPSSFFYGEDKGALSVIKRLFA